MPIEVIPRMLLSGFAQQSIDVQLLDHFGVTHIVNASDLPLPEIVSKQFQTLQLRPVNLDVEQNQKYWFKLFDFMKRALEVPQSVVYFQIAPEAWHRPAFPVAAYAGLLVMNYSSVESRRMPLAVHPTVTQHYGAVALVDYAFKNWAGANGYEVPAEEHVPAFLRPVEETVSLSEVLKGAEEWD